VELVWTKSDFLIAAVALSSTLVFHCRYQMADWRQRPLPAEMLFYARQDTHYLLYVYDRLKNELIETSQVQRRHQHTFHINKRLSFCHVSLCVCVQHE